MNWREINLGRGGSLSTRKLKVIKSNIDFVKKLVKKDHSILDIGCSESDFLRQVDAKLKVGMDIDKSIKPRGFKFYSSLNDIKEKFDIITMFNVIEHLNMSEGVRYIKWCSKHLKKGGRLIITTPNINCPLNAYYFWTDITHIKPLPYKDFSTLLKKYFKQVNVYKYARVAWFRIPFCILGGDIYLDLLFDCLR